MHLQPRLIPTAYQVSPTRAHEAPRQGIRGYVGSTFFPIRSGYFPSARFCRTQTGPPDSNRTLNPPDSETFGRAWREHNAGRTPDQHATHQRPVGLA